MNTLCGKNAELLTVKAGGTHSLHWAFKGLLEIRRSISDIKYADRGTYALSSIHVNILYLMVSKLDHM
jgi:hypothetical protein